MRARGYTLRQIAERYGVTERIAQRWVENIQAWPFRLTTSSGVRLRRLPLLEVPR